MRLFFAVNLPDEELDILENAQKKLSSLAPGNDIRWARRDQFHFTLKFLGEQPAVRAQKAAELALQVGYSFAPFFITLSGFGAFPNSERPNVLWMGMEEGADEMQKLSSSIDSGLRSLGFKLDNKPYKPHLSLARIKTYPQEMAAAQILLRSNLIIQVRVKVSSFSLMQSSLLPSGSEYTEVEKFAFSE
jgi:2'-5' RNA ligase